MHKSLRWTICLLATTWKLILHFFCSADYGIDQYDIGTAFGHFGIAVDDVSFCYVKSIYHFLRFTDFKYWNAIVVTLFNTL